MRMWGNWNPCTLVVGMENGATTMENGTNVPQKIKNKVPYDPAIALLGIYLKALKSRS